jgi:hypothetical protein
MRTKSIRSELGAKKRKPKTLRMRARNTKSENIRNENEKHQE